MKRMLIIMALALALSSAEADICNIAGFVFDSGPAPLGIKVSITNLEYGVTYTTATGTGWQYPNYYLQTITCTVGKDMVRISIEDDGRTASREIIPDSRLVQVNLTLPPLPAEPDNEKSSGGGSGGGNGGGGIMPDITVDTQQDHVYNLTEDSNLSIFTLDRWFNLERYFISIKEIGKDSVRLELSTITLDLDKGERKQADINGDGISDYDIMLEDVNGSIAYIRFYKAWNPILAEEGIDLSEPRISEEVPASLPQESPVFLFIMVVILVILTLILIIRDRRGR